MADAKALRYIGFGFGAVTVAVTLIAGMLVAGIDASLLLAAN